MTVYYTVQFIIIYQIIYIFYLLPKRSRSGTADSVTNWELSDTLASTVVKSIVTVSRGLETLFILKGGLAGPPR